MASDSLTNTNISDTYVGVLHARGAAIPASGLVDVYDGFGNKSSLKIGRAGQGISIDGSVDVSGTLGDAFTTAIADAIYPIGSVLFSTDDNNPGDRFPGTTWVQEAEGRFIAGVGTGNDGTESVAIAAGNDSVGKYNHQLTELEMPEHSHTQLGGGFNGSDGIESGNQRTQDLGQTGTTGSNQPHNNRPPSFGLYVWKRTANS